MPTRSYSLAEVATTVRQLEAGNVCGQVVITPRSRPPVLREPGVSHTTPANCSGARHKTAPAETYLQWERLGLRSTNQLSRRDCASPSTARLPRN
jgi:hypothetical protein